MELKDFSNKHQGHSVLVAALVKETANSSMSQGRTMAAKFDALLARFNPRTGFEDIAISVAVKFPKKSLEALTDLIIGEIENGLSQNRRLIEEIQAEKRDILLKIEAYEQEIAQLMI
ncbi:hypothetical protein [Puniceicoccus vermicola]|uniref:Uncharacterized protein n=1 Tax=Puniceicoccus vermicola TaxID=388746 RepID=A0A7X1AXC7_9BACT|nr:hypothetical protein [Puniceicoccus vermicola]MBC2601763.1 hypothetical protein [Puniceicoccus vermicola]